MASKYNGGNLDTDWARAPPQHGSCCERFFKIIYNPEENSCFGRTPKRWGIVLTFYAIFYAVLAAMFAACMAGLFYTLEEDKPVYILDSSLIGTNPGVSYRPQPTDGGFLLKYHATSGNSTQLIIHQLENFFFDYKHESWYSDKKECVAEDSFGFPDTPCLFIKVNKIYGWEPAYYDASSLPADMGEDLIQYISTLKPEEQKQVWISCWDEYGNSTQFEYPWGRGLAGTFFPFLNGVGHKNPVLAVRVTPEAENLATIRCRAWAKNIVYNKSIKDARGYARIQLQVEYNTENTTTANTE